MATLSAIQSLAQLGVAINVGGAAYLSAIIDTNSPLSREIGRLNEIYQDLGDFLKRTNEQTSINIVSAINDHENIRHRFQLARARLEIIYTSFIIPLQFLLCLISLYYLIMSSFQPTNNLDTFQATVITFALIFPIGAMLGFSMYHWYSSTYTRRKFLQIERSVNKHVNYAWTTPTREPPEA